MEKNFCLLILVFLTIYLAKQIYYNYSEKRMLEKMTNMKQIISDVDDGNDIANAVELSKLTIINEPIITLYKKNTNHITNSDNSLIHKITHPLRFRFKFNGKRYNLHEMRIIKSERLVSLGEPFDIEIHLIHRDDNDINNLLIIVFPVKKADNKKASGLLEKLLLSVSDIPEKNKFNTYNGRIQTIDYSCFNKYLQDTEICFYSQYKKTYLITQKPIFGEKKYIKRIKQVLR